MPLTSCAILTSDGASESFTTSRRERANGFTFSNNRTIPIRILCRRLKRYYGMDTKWAERGFGRSPRRGWRGWLSSGHGLGIGGFLIVLVLSLLFHRNFFALLGDGSGGTAATTAARPTIALKASRMAHLNSECIGFRKVLPQAIWTGAILSSSEAARYAPASHPFALIRLLAAT